MPSDNRLENETIEDTIPSLIENDNSKNTSRLSHVASAPVISTTMDIPTMNDSDIIESNSLGKNFVIEKNKLILLILFFVEASPNVAKKKSNRCCWDTCKKKLGLTGKIFFSKKKKHFSKNFVFL